MARNILKRFFPTPAAIKSNPALHFLGDLLHDPNLFHLNRHSVSVAFFWGTFIAFAFPLPGQMAVAALAALYFRCNLPISVALVWITNPLTIPVVFFLTYKIGCLILGIPEEAFKFELSWSWIINELERLAPPFLLGSVIMGLVFGALGYFGMQFFWRWHVVRNWEKRKNRPFKKKHKKEPKSGSANQESAATADEDTAVTDASTVVTDKSTAAVDTAVANQETGSANTKTSEPKSST